MPKISQRTTRATWAKSVNRKDVSRIGVLMGHPSKAYRPDGELRDKVADELAHLADKILRIRKGRKIDGLRCATPDHEVLCADPFTYAHGPDLVELDDYERAAGWDF